MATGRLDLTEVFETLKSRRRVARLTAAAGAEAQLAMHRRAAERLTGEPVPAGGIGRRQGVAGPVTGVYEVITPSSRRSSRSTPFPLIRPKRLNGRPSCLVSG